MTRIPLRQIRRRTTLMTLVLTILLIVVSGCEESVDPFIESDRYFSLFGTLDMNADTQWVRVVPIDTTIGLTDSNPIDATVSSTDMFTGDITTWSDSLFEFSDGSFGHVFHAPVRVQPSHTYRLEAARADGKRTWVQTSLPPIPRATVENPERFELSSGRAVVSQSVVWNGVDRNPGSVAVWYRFSASSKGDFVDIRVPYPTADFDADPGWEIRVQLTNDVAIVNSQIDPGDFTLLGLGMTISLLDERFIPPGGVFDPDVLSQPGAFSNVENGFGFVGSIGRFDVQWILDEQTAIDLGYRLPKR